MKTAAEVICYELATGGEFASAYAIVAALNAAGYLIVEKGSIGRAQLEAVAQYREEAKARAIDAGIKAFKEAA